MYLNFFRGSSVNALYLQQNISLCCPKFCTLIYWTCMSTIIKSDLQFVSLLIGHNDFCTDICWIPSPWSSLAQHKADLLQVLRTLRDNLPRTFVALLPPVHLKALVDSRKGRPSFKCFLTTDFECSCLFGLAFRRFRPIYYEIMRQ